LCKLLLAAKRKTAADRFSNGPPRRETPLERGRACATFELPAGVPAPKKRAFLFFLLDGFFMSRWRNGSNKSGTRPTSISMSADGLDFSCAL
jgi:hypothetical protein